MKIRVAASVVLLQIGLGLLLGPHPCQGLAGKATPSETTPASCHEAGSASGPVLKSAGASHDCCDAEHQRSCEMVCQGVTAVLAHGPSASLARPAERFSPLSMQPALPLLARSIDHIPLS